MNIYPLNYYLHPEEESVPRDEIRVLEEEEVGDDGEGGRVRLWRRNATVVGEC